MISQTENKPTQQEDHMKNKMKVYNQKTGRVCQPQDYIGNFYGSQSSPQPILLYISAIDYYIETSEDVGEATGGEVWRKKMIIFNLGVTVFLKSHVEKLLIAWKPHIEELQNLYISEDYWDNSLKMRLCKQIDEDTYELMNELIWDREGKINHRNALQRYRRYNKKINYKSLVLGKEIQ